MRPFADPPQIIDMTADAAYEKMWMPLETANKREAVRAAKEERLKWLMTRRDGGGLIDIIKEQEEERRAKYFYNKRYV